MGAAIVPLVWILASHTLPVAKVADKDDSCPMTPLVWDTAPRDRNAQGVGGNFYVNADRTIWAGTVPEGGWTSDDGHKTYWVRPQGTRLVITGRRLDLEAAPLEARIPCCYPTGFQIVGLRFPSEGCWEVHATAGDHELRFVTRVNPTGISRDRR
jgi:hypothetical protein